MLPTIIYEFYVIMGNINKTVSSFIVPDVTSSVHFGTLMTIL